MAIKPVCDKTKEELTEPGGLVFGPRYRNRRRKFHLCVAAWEEFVDSPFTVDGYGPGDSISNIAFAVEPPASVESASWVRDYYIGVTEWDAFIAWLGEAKKEGDKS